MTFGKKLRIARQKKGYTQKELAKLVGAKHNSVSNWENDQNKPDPDTIELICGVLGITPNYILGASQDEIMDERSKALIKKYQSLNETGKDDVDKYTDYVMSNPANLASVPAPQAKVVHQEIAAKGIDVKSREIEVDPRSIRKSRGKMILHILEDEENQ